MSKKKVTWPLRLLKWLESGLLYATLIVGAVTLWGPLIAAIVFSVLAETLRLQALWPSPSTG